MIAFKLKTGTIVPACITVAIVAGIIAVAEDASLVMRALTAKAKARSAMKYKEWDLYDSLPDGWKFCKAAGSPLCGYEFASSGSPLKGGKTALVKVPRGTNEYRQTETKIEAPKEKPQEPIDENCSRTLNNLARLKFQERMMADILIDLQVCEIEGWCKTEYIREIRRLVYGLLRNASKGIEMKKRQGQFVLNLDAPCGAST